MEIRTHAPFNSGKQDIETDTKGRREEDFSKVTSLSLSVLLALTSRKFFIYILFYLHNQYTVLTIQCTLNSTYRVHCIYIVVHYRLLGLRNYLFVPFLDIDDHCKCRKCEAGSKWGSRWSSHGARPAPGPSPVTRPEASVATAVPGLRESDLSHVTEGRRLSASQGVAWGSLQGVLTGGHALVEGREAGWQGG